MKQKIMALTLALSLALSLCACGGDGNTPDADKVDPDSGSQTTSPAAGAQEVCTVDEGQPYSEGLAWVVYRDGSGNTRTGAIDREGKVQFYVEGAAECTPFQDGQSYVTTEDSLLLVDSSGAILRDFAQDLDGLELAAYGGGVVIARGTSSDILDGTKESYTAIDASGNKTKLDKAIRSSGYCSGGIFEASSYDCYFGRTGLWLSQAIADAGMEAAFSPKEFEQLLQIYDDCAVRTVPIWDMYMSETSSEVLPLFYLEKDATAGTAVDLAGLLSSAGEGQLFSALLSNSDIAPENAIMFMALEASYESDYANPHCFVDLRDGTIRTYTGEYASLFRGLISDAGEDRIALELYGKDKKNYLLITDRELNEVSEPIPVSTSETINSSFYVISGGYVIAETGIWDLTGKQVSDGSFADLTRVVTATQDETPVGDGVIQTAPGVYYDCTGQLLFQQADCSGAKPLA